MSDSVHTAPVSPAPAAMPRPAPTPRTRRVGTMTLGLALIIVGVCLCIYLFYPAFDIFFVMKLVPLLLVFLGAELLWFTFRRREEQIRYDFLSTVMCALIFIGAFGCVTAAKYVEVASADNRSQQMSAAWEQRITQELEGVDDVTQLDVYIDFDEWAMVESGVPSSLDDAIERNLIRYANVYVQLSGSYASQAEFLAACETVRDAIGACGISYPDVQFYTPGADEARPVAYSLNIGGSFDYARPLADIGAQRLSETVWQPPESAVSSGTEMDLG